MVRSMKRVFLIVLLLAALLLSACGGAAVESAPKPEPTAAAETAPAETEAPAPAESGTPAPQKSEAQAEDESAARTEVEAATVEELLAAIAPNTVIKLTGRSYNLCDAVGYGNFGGDYYDWENGYDGWQLSISGVSGLTIKADKPGTEIVTAPRYAAVLRFADCEDVTLSGFTAGHTNGAGMCTGAVLSCQNCKNFSIDHCDLYGCGTYGLELDHCRNFSVRDSSLRDCSYGASWVLCSSNVVLEDCMVYGISNYNGVFWFSSCRDCAVLGTLVRNCSGNSLLWSEYSTVFLGGCEISDNSLDGMFFASWNPITVEGCSFKNNSGPWYFEDWGTSERAVSAAGNPWTDRDLSDMKLDRNVRWEPLAAESPVVEPIAPSEDGMIHVSTVDEMLASIASDVTIYLEDGVYNLSEASDYGAGDRDAYSWMPCYDGPGLVIRNVSNLTVKAGGPHRVSIVSEPRYAYVLSFEGCSGVTLSNFTAGHTQEPSECAGGVLSFLDCEQTVIEDCSLYGCGIYGVSTYSCSDLSVLYTEVHHCSYGAFDFSESRDISVEHCNIHDNGGPDFQVYACRNVIADGKAVK